MPPTSCGGRWVPGARGDAAENKTAWEPKQRAGGQCCSRGPVPWGPGEEQHPRQGPATAGRGPTPQWGAYNGVSEQGPLPQWGAHTGGCQSRGPAAVGKGVCTSHRVSPGLLHVADVGLPHHLLVVRGCLPQPQLGTSQGKSGDEEDVQA